jgi:MFS family permease
MFCFDSESVSSIRLGKTLKKSSVTYEENLILQNPRYKSSVFYMEERTIQSVPVMPFALMLACISAVMGLIVGVFYAAIFGAIFSGLPSSATGTLGFNLGWLGLIFGIGAIITMPILFFILGLIQGVIYAWVYNFLAPRIGGIKLRFKEEYRAPPQQ